MKFFINYFFCVISCTCLYTCVILSFLQAHLETISATMNDAVASLQNLERQIQNKVKQKITALEAKDNLVSFQIPVEDEIQVSVQLLQIFCMALRQVLT